MIDLDEAIAMAKELRIKTAIRIVYEKEIHTLVNAAYAKGLEDAAVFAVGDLIGERHSQVGERIAHGIRLMKEKK